MKTTVHHDDDRPFHPGPVSCKTGELDGGLVSFRARVSKKDGVQTAAPDEGFGQAFLPPHPV